MSSFGTVNDLHPRFGECLYCWDENWTRDHQFSFESRSRMVGQVCGHRLHAQKRHALQHSLNAMNDETRMLPGRWQDYWHRRALLPDYCGEFRELCPGPANDQLCEGQRRQCNGLDESSRIER